MCIGAKYMDAEVKSKLEGLFIVIIRFPVEDQKSTFVEMVKFQKENKQRRFPAWQIRIIRTKYEQALTLVETPYI